ncbi:MAG: TonB-dependent receptor [Bacteroidales bacterium]|nr:TonB-dependent receptor [Bacteroidales bacterium]
MLFSILFSAGLLSAGLPYGFEEPVCDSLHAVTVTADRGVIVSRTDTLSVDNSFTISDVLLQSPGLYLGDNGGLGGLKTVSLRGMGSAHTAIYVDGVRVGNIQSGQNDLGMLGLESYEAAVVDYAQNSVSFTTAKPVFDDSPVSGYARLSTASFGTYLPSARLDFRLSDRLSLSANAAGIISKGDFKYGDGLRRTNNDLKKVRAGLDLFGLMGGGEYHVKAYYNGAERGTPGSVSYPSDDRQKDRNAFLQGTLRKNFSPLYTLRVSAKGSYDDIYYTSSWGDSRYGQTEFQLNSAHDFQIKDWWKLSFAADARWDALMSTNYEASRLTALSALASSFRTERFMATVALEYEGAFDRDGLSRNAFSPSADLRFTAFDGFDIVAFGRRAYRIPTFNELYYVGYGNPQLTPEDTWMTDLGIDFNRRINARWTMKLKADAFYNFLKNKIVSAPTEEDPNIWAPYNIGKVRSAGMDVIAGTKYTNGDWNASAEIRYSYQSAIDKTPDSYTYDTPVPYVARHTAVLHADVSWKGLTMTPVWQSRAGRTDSMGEMPDWNTLDINFSKSFTLSEGSIILKCYAKNILDCRYETVSGYPMPGRSLIGGVEYKF